MFERLDASNIFPAWCAAKKLRVDVAWLCNDTGRIRRAPDLRQFGYVHNDFDDLTTMFAFFFQRGDLASCQLPMRLGLRTTTRFDALIGMPLLQCGVSSSAHKSCDNNRPMNPDGVVGHRK